MTSNIEGLDNLNKQIRALKKLPTKEALLQGGYVLMAQSVKNAPVDTGNLRNSHEVVETKEGVELQVHAEYAYFVEFGTSKMEARSYVRTAIESEGENILKAIKGELEPTIEETIK